MQRLTPLLGTPAQIARRLTFATAAGVFMGLIGPFGSYDVHPLERVACWLLSFWTGSLIFGPALALAEAWSAASTVPRWFARPVAVAVAAAPLSIIAAACFHFVGHVPVTRMAWLVWYAQVLAIGLPVSLGYLAFHAMQPARGQPTAEQLPAATDPPAGRETPASLVDRLPSRLGRDLVALEMEDHYVRAHTPLGSDLLLLPMAQAVEALAQVEGLRVHRSWWVARAAVQGHAWEGRNLRLTLRGGLEAPVARAQVATVRAAGWLG